MHEGSELQDLGTFLLFGRSRERGLMSDDGEEVFWDCTICSGERDRAAATARMARAASTTAARRSSQRAMLLLVLPDFRRWAMCSLHWSMPIQRRAS